MLRTLKNNKKGIVFVTVLMIIIVMMVLAISIVSMNVSQVLTTETEVRRVQAEIIAFGMLAFTFANQASSSPGSYITNTYTLDGTTYNVAATVGPAGSGILGTSNLIINVTY